MFLWFEDRTKGSKKKCKILVIKRDRRIWSAKEEKMLIDILFDMNNSGWKVDTGHKSGYLSHIEKEMAKKMPNSDIKADPHIKSKVKVWKKHLSYVLAIQQYGSGFGWDDDKKMVTGDKDIFMGWEKVMLQYNLIMLGCLNLFHTYIICQFFFRAEMELRLCE